LDKLAFAAVAVFVFTVTWNGIRVGGGAFGDGFMALALAAVIAYVVAEKRPLPLPPWLLVAAIGFFLAGLLTMIFPPSVAVVQRSVLAQLTIKLEDGIQGLTAIPSNTSELIKYELSLVVPLLVIGATAFTPARCRTLVNAWTAGAIVNGCVGIVDYAGLHIAPVPFTDNRSAGLTVQSNYLALTCVLAIPMAMLWFGRSRRWTAAGVFGVIALLGGVYASGSRAGTVAALLAVAATIVLVPRLRPALPTVVPVAGMAIVAALAFTNLGTKVLSQIRLGSSSTSTTFSDDQRTLEAQVAYAQIKARPIEGVGFSVIGNAHDLYLELLDAGGVIALGSFLVFVGGLGVSARRSVRGPLGDEAIVCSIAVVAWLANGVFDNQLADKYLYVVPGLLWAIARTTLLLGAPRRAPPPVQPDPSRDPIGVGQLDEVPQAVAVAPAGVP
jgi:O-antigen ligase